MKFGVVAVVAAGVALVAGGLHFSRPTCDQSAIYGAVKSEMAQYLKAPSTAIYQPWTQVSEEAVKGGCAYRVKGFVESQNGFGAMTKSTFSATALKGTDGGYKAIILTINGKLPGL
jgi:hypothetical protein